MNNINDLNSILNRLSVYERRATSRTDKNHSNSDARPISTRNHFSKQSLKVVVKERINELERQKGPLEAPDKIQVFVEATLIWKFGNDILRDKQTHAIIQRTFQACHEHPAIQNEIIAAIEELQTQNT